MDYLPFGYTIPASATDPRSGVTDTCNGVSVTTYMQDPAFRQRFTGKERDSETGLDYFGARYFSGAQGRFTSPDPLLNSGRPWQPQSWNRYPYALNNPLKFTDPTGLYEWGTCSGSKEECKNAQKAFQDALAKLRSTANGMKADSTERKRLEGVLKAYGNFGDKGVTVGFNTGAAKNFAETNVAGMASVVVAGANGSLQRENRVNVDVRFNIASEYGSVTDRGLNFADAFMFETPPRTPDRGPFRLLVRAGAVLTAIALLWVVGASQFVTRTARGRTYSEAAAIPARRVGLVLGCSRLLGDGRRNTFFDNRIQAAAELFQARKIDYFVVSGDNHVRGYDEPQDMKDSLVLAGVPAERIYCDYAGFRTLDSIVRVREIFGQTAITVISQQFHNERAIAIARYRGVDAIGFNAAEVDAYNSFKTKCREQIARANMMLDLFVFRRAPRFLGERVAIPEGAS
jgi:SanA protein